MHWPTLPFFFFSIFSLKKKENEVSERSISRRPVSLREKKNNFLFFIFSDIFPRPLSAACVHVYRLFLFSGFQVSKKKEKKKKFPTHS